MQKPKRMHGSDSSGRRRRTEDTTRRKLRAQPRSRPGSRRAPASLLLQFYPLESEQPCMHTCSCHPQLLTLPAASMQDSTGPHCTCPPCLQHRQLTLPAASMQESTGSRSRCADSTRQYTRSPTCGTGTKGAGMCYSQSSCREQALLRAEHPRRDARQQHRQPCRGHNNSMQAGMQAGRQTPQRLRTSMCGRLRLVAPSNASTGSSARKGAPMSTP